MENIFHKNIFNIFIFHCKMGRNIFQNNNTMDTDNHVCKKYVLYKETNLLKIMIKFVEISICFASWHFCLCSYDYIQCYINLAKMMKTNKQTENINKLGLF